MRTFVNLQPGEHRSCIGCHEDRRQTPGSRAVTRAALRQPVVRPVAQPGDDVVPRPLHYPADVQPVLDKHCVRCHGGAAPDGKLNLSGTPTPLFSRSYEELLDKGYARGFSEWTRNPKDSAVPPPYSQGSHASTLIGVLRKGHADVKLSQAEFIKLATWVDMNLPYYGTYFGRRNLIYKDQPDFRPMPTLASTQRAASAENAATASGAKVK